MKLKEETKNNLALLGILVMIVIGSLLISVRNQQINQEMQKKTEMSVTQISQK